MVSGSQLPLTDHEREGIVLAVKSAFVKLTNLYHEIEPIIRRYGFAAPSPGVLARDLSERIETSIVQHCGSFTKGSKHCDLSREEHDWEVKIAKGSGLTINQSKLVQGENYIVVNYDSQTQVRKVWVLWNARDEFFSPRKSNTNARSLLATSASEHLDVLFDAGRANRESELAFRRGVPAKASLAHRSIKSTA